MLDKSAPSSVVTPRWRGADLAIAVVLVVLGFGVLVGALAGAASVFDLDGRADVAASALGAVATLLFEVWLGAVVWLVARRRRLPGDPFGLDWPASWRWAAGAVLGAYAVLFLYTWLLLALEQVAGLDLGRVRDGNALPDVPHNAVAVWALLGLSVVVVAPLAEELLFRGFLFRALSGLIGFPAGLLLSALAFSVVHLDMGVVVPFFLIGIIFAWTYHASGSLWTSVAAHATFNLVSFVATLIGVRA